MSQRVFICPCGWQGFAVGGHRSRPGVPPARCPSCGRADFRLESHQHGRITRTCVVCGQPFLGGRTAQACPTPCRVTQRHQQLTESWRARKKYMWTPARDQVLRDRYDGKVRGRAAVIARALGWPAWVVKRRAAQLGLTHPVDRRDYTAEEVTVLEEWTGHYSSDSIAKRLGRSLTSVVLKQKRMGLSRRVRDGYTLRDLELCFGTDHRVIERWVREGKLTIRKRGTGRAGKQGDTWSVSDTQLVAFVRDHPLAFRLDKVDQVWFMDLVTGGGLLRRPADSGDQTAEAAPC